MRKTIMVLMLLWVAAPNAYAQLSGSSAVYIGGTIPGLKPGSSGTIDLTVPAEMMFLSGEAKFGFPYAGIQSYEYTNKLARHIGVIPTIAVVAVVNHRQHRHFITISFTDSQGTIQTVVLEISKHMPDVILPVLDTRAPKSAKKTISGHHHLFH